MSTITKTWSEDKIRSIIRKLDEKTGLNGAALPIAFNSYGSSGTTIMLSLKRSGSTVSFSTTRPPGKPR